MSAASPGQPFNPRLVIGLIVAGLTAFAALVLLIAFGNDIGAGRSGRAHALSVSATGYKGLVNLVSGFRETYLIRSERDWATDELVVVALEPQSRPAEVRRLLEARSGLPTLIILPKWLTEPDPVRRGWIRASFPGAGAAAVRHLGDDLEVRVAGGRPGTAIGEDLLAGWSAPVPQRPQLISGPNLWPLATLGGADESGKPAADAPALVAMIGNQPHYIVADPDLLNNHGLRDPATARAALALVDALNAPGIESVAFDLTVNGFGSGSRGMLRLAFEPPFLAMTLALIVAALLAGLHGAFRFGPVRRAERAIAFGKTALVENSAGLIRLAEREAHLGGAYADVVRHEAARATHAPASLQGEALDAHLDRVGRHGRRDETQAPFSTLAHALATARDRHTLMTAARAWFRWKREVVR